MININEALADPNSLDCGEKVADTKLSREKIAQKFLEHGGVLSSETDSSLKKFLVDHEVIEPCLLLSPAVARCFYTYYSGTVDSNFSLAALGLAEYPPQLYSERHDLNIPHFPLRIDARGDMGGDLVICPENTHDYEREDIAPLDQGKRSQIFDEEEVAFVIRFGDYYKELLEHIGNNLEAPVTSSESSVQIDQVKLDSFKNTIKGTVISEFKYQDKQVPDEIRQAAGLYESPQGHVVLNIDEIKDVGLRNQLIVVMWAMRDFVDDLAWPHGGNGTAKLGILSTGGRYKELTDLSEISSETSCIVCSWDYD